MRPVWNRRSSAVALAVCACAWLFGGCAPHAPAGRTDARASIVLIHGLGANPADWTDIANDLSVDHRIVLEALPGHSHAPMPDSLPLEQAVERVTAVVRTLPPPVFVVGHSVGGLVAVRVALRARDRVRGVVLVETALRPQLPAAERRAFLAALEREPDRELHNAYAAFGNDSLQGADLAREAAQVDPAAFRAWLGEALSADLSLEAAAIAAPVLIVLAPHSWAPGESWPAVAESLGYTGIVHAEPVRIDSCAHFVMLDQPAAMARLIRSWVARESAAKF